MADAQVPVILVGNKIDLRGGEVTNQALEEEVAPIMREFKVSKNRRLWASKQLHASFPFYS